MRKFRTKNIITINDEDFSAGDTIKYLCLELKDGTERELLILLKWIQLYNMMKSK